MTRTFQVNGRQNKLVLSVMGVAEALLHCMLSCMLLQFELHARLTNAPDLAVKLHCMLL